ncbi:hypothetical protein [Falsiruegeria litorea]|uniref:hypothetical protein n=1 Tax=Falsiruegeria litorea TaxID=1280831 RepID=UPI00105691F1|nr:hypothetical protein [Falsiruegeria litorea]
MIGTTDGQMHLPVTGLSVWLDVSTPTELLNILRRDSDIDETVWQAERTPTLMLKITPTDQLPDAKN